VKQTGYALMEALEFVPEALRTQVRRRLKSGE